LIAVLFASTLPVVAPVTMRTSISFHHRQTVRVELVRLRPAGSLDQCSLDQFPEFLFGRDRGGVGPGPQQGPELVFDSADGLQRAGRVIRGEDFRQAVRCLVCDGLAGAASGAPRHCARSSRGGP
jgi:hypothetical protein